MEEQPVANVRRKMIRDMLGLAVGGAVSVASRSLPVLPPGGGAEAPPEDPGRVSSWLQGRLAEKTGLTIRQVDESNLDDLLLDLRATLQRGGAAIRIPREEFVRFLATYAGVKIYQEKLVHLTDVQFSKEENGTVFDIIAHASFGRLFVQVRRNPVTEGEVSDFLKLCEAMGMEEGWLVAPGLESKLVWGEPIRLWENRYVLPAVRLMSYDPLFEWLLSAVLPPSVERTVVPDEQAVVLLLSLKEGQGAPPSPPSPPEGTREKREAS